MPSEFADHAVALKKPVKARGKALRRSDAELGDMTSSDALRDLLGGASTDWRENSPDTYKRLVGAKKA